MRRRKREGPASSEGSTRSTGIAFRGSERTARSADPACSSPNMWIACPAAAVDTPNSPRNDSSPASLRRMLNSVTYSPASPRRLVWIDFQAPDLVTWVQIPTRALLTASGLPSSHQVLGVLQKFH